MASPMSFTLLMVLVIVILQYLLSVIIWRICGLFGLTVRMRHKQARASSQVERSPGAKLQGKNATGHPGAMETSDRNTQPSKSSGRNPLPRDLRREDGGPEQPDALPSGLLSVEDSDTHQVGQKRAPGTKLQHLKPPGLPQIEDTGNVPLPTSSSTGSPSDSPPGGSSNFTFDSPRSSPPGSRDGRIDENQGTRKNPRKAHATRPEDKQVDKDAQGLYTDGPVKLVSVHDGTKSCSALLLKSDLSAKIKEAILFRRTLLRERAFADRQEAEIRRFESEIHAEIADKIVLIERRADASRGTNSGSPGPLQSDLDVLQLLERQWEAERLSCGTAVTDGNDIFQDLQIDIMACFDAAFVEAQMVEPEEKQEDPILVPNLAEEFHKASDGRTYEPTPVHRPVSTPEEDAEWERRLAIREAKYAAKAEILSTFRKALVARDYYQKQFDTKGIYRTYQWQMHRQAEVTRKEAYDRSRFDFAVRWARLYGLAEEELHTAKIAFAKARDAAIEAGIRVAEYDTEQVPEVPWLQGGAKKRSNSM